MSVRLLRIADNCLQKAIIDWLRIATDAPKDLQIVDMSFDAPRNEWATRCRSSKWTEMGEWKPTCVEGRIRVATIAANTVGHKQWRLCWDCGEHEGQIVQESGVPLCLSCKVKRDGITVVVPVNEAKEAKDK